MDRVERVRYIADLGRHERESRSEHLALLEGLEDGSGLNLDVYAAIYGKNALDGMDENAVKLRQNWAEFLAALNSDHRYTAVINPYQVAPSRYGPEPGPQHHIGVNMVIIDGTAKILAVSESETEASYVVQGDHVFYLHGSELTIQMTAELACTSDNDRSWSYPYWEEDKPKRVLSPGSKIIVADDTRSLSVQLSHALNEVQRSDIYFHNPHFKIDAALREYDQDLAQKELV